MTKPGTKVLISQDCRDGHPATGQIGIYEGDFPYSVTLGYRPEGVEETEWKGEFGYDDYKSGAVKFKGGTPVNSIYAEWVLGEKQPAPFFAMPSNNPRIRLPDGSTIWGAECWWGEVVEGVTLEEAQAQTEEVKKAIVSILNGAPK